MNSELVHSNSQSSIHHLYLVLENIYRKPFQLFWQRLKVVRERVPGEKGGNLGINHYCSHSHVTQTQSLWQLDELASTPPVMKVAMRSPATKSITKALDTDGWCSWGWEHQVIRHLSLINTKITAIHSISFSNMACPSKSVYIKPAAVVTICQQAQGEN